MSIGRFAAVVSLAMLLGACGAPKPAPPQNQAALPTVYAVNYPLAYFAERIGGDAVEVVFPAPPDEDPAYWQPSREALESFQSADLILLNGAGYAKWAATAALPEDRSVDTSAAFADRHIRMEDAVEHSHGPEGMHAHEGTDFNTWLDPGLALKQAEAVQVALKPLAPGADLSALAADLRALDADLRAAAEKLGDAAIIASHPVYAYLARAYQLNVSSLHWEPGETPPDTEWGHLAELMEHTGAKIMLWEGGPAPAVAERLREMGLRLVVFPPCGNRPETGDYMSVMRESCARLAEAAIAVKTG